MSLTELQGRAENHLLAREKESGGTFRAIMLRPGYFFPSLNYPADARNLRGVPMRIAEKTLGGLSRWAFGITVEDLGRFAVEAVKGTWDDMGPYHQNDDMKKLVKNLPS